MKQYTEVEVTQAIEAVSSGKSIRKAALEWGIPRATLRKRLLGAQPHKQAAEHLQRLSPAQEDLLAKWVLTQAALGLPPTHQQLQLFAQRILDVGGDPQPLGKSWVTGFLKRNPNLKVQRARSLDSKRANGASTENIRGWWPNLALPAVKEVLPRNRWNMDEAGIMEGQGTNGLVLGSSEKQSVQKTQPGSRVWTSFIECISATGISLPPLVIFKGITVQQQWFPTDLQPMKDWLFTATPNGWTDNKSGLEWLQKVFIPRTQPEDPHAARLLVLDGHGSHESDEFMWECFHNNIYLLFLPPHSSHVLQPLDLSVFSPLKHAYRTQLSKLGFTPDSSASGKRTFLRCYQKARENALTAQNIKAGWLATGLWPVNIAKPLMSRLLLENNRSRRAEKRREQGDQSPGPKERSDFVLETSLVIWKTPDKSKEVGDQLALFNKVNGTSNTQRLLFTKVQKSFHQKDFLLASALQKIDSLEAKLEAVRPIKRRKVKTSPNSKFVGIRAIQHAQMEAGAIEIEDAESEGSEVTSNGESCIVVAQSVGN